MLGSVTREIPARHAGLRVGQSGSAVQSRFEVRLTDQSALTLLLTVVRAEHQVRLPRNMSLDIDEDSFARWTLARKLRVEDSFEKRARVAGDYVTTRITALAGRLAGQSSLPQAVVDGFKEAESVFALRLYEHAHRQVTHFHTWEGFIQDKDARLSCLQEEPARAKTDILLAIKIPDVPQAETFRLIVEPREQKPRPERHVTMKQLFTTAVNTSNQADPAHLDPAGGLGVPDLKDVAQVLVDEESYRPQPTIEKDFDTMPNDSTEVNVSMIIDMLQDLAGTFFALAFLHLLTG